MKDLGVTMTTGGTFKKHIQHAVSEAKRQCKWILRTFGTRQVLPMLTLWKSLVQCKLDHCSQLWCPTETADIQYIQSMVSSFLKQYLHNTTECSVETFQWRLDNDLRTVHEEPLIPGYTAQRRAGTNSLLDMAQFGTAHHIPMVEVPGGSHPPSSRGCAPSVAETH